MHASKRKKLEAAGYRVGHAADFLGLSPEETALIDMKVKLSSQLVELRKKARISQGVLAKMIGSSQSRVAKMEACDPSVSMDLMFKAAFALGADQAKIGKFITSMSGAAVTKRKAATKNRPAPGKVVTKNKAAAKTKAPAKAAVA